MCLPITPGGNHGPGHFYLAKNRTFLLCVDTHSGRCRLGPNAVTGHLESPKTTDSQTNSLLFPVTRISRFDFCAVTRAWVGTSGANAARNQLFGGGFPVFFPVLRRRVVRS